MEKSKSIVTRDENGDEYEILTEDSAVKMWGRMPAGSFACYLRGYGNCLTPQELSVFQKNILSYRRLYRKNRGKDLEEYFENGNIPDEAFFDNLPMEEDF